MPKRRLPLFAESEVRHIHRFPIFASLSLSELVNVLSKGERFHYHKGQTICMEDEPGEDFYLVLEGKVKISLLSEEGKELILSTRSAEEFFGEMAIIEGKPRSASVVALEATEMIAFGKKPFLALIHKYPGIALKFLQSLCARLREADVKIRTLALLDVYGRVARTLLDLARLEGRRELDGSLAFQRPTQEEIAKMIGASRETVSRIRPPASHISNRVASSGLLRRFSVLARGGLAIAFSTALATPNAGTSAVANAATERCF